MKRWKLCAAALCVAVSCSIPVLAHSHPGDPEPPTPVLSDWAREEVARARELGLVPRDLPEDYRSSITRADFRSLAMRYVSAQEHYGDGNIVGLILHYLGTEDKDGYAQTIFTDSTDYSDTAAHLIGVVQGRGDGTFDPKGLVTREEAAAMLTRAYGVCGGKLPESTDSNSFSDEEEIASWAQESTEALAFWNVMQGLPDGSFSPKEPYSVEQCILTFLRLYENAPVSRKNGNVTPLFTYEQGIRYFEDTTARSRRINTGDFESLRIEGPEATFIRMDWGGSMQCISSFYFVYRDGGVHSLDLGLCVRYGHLVPEQILDNVRFSEDGKTFTCTTTRSRSTLDVMDDAKIWHEAGVYQITIDVDTCAYQLQREPLPSSSS